MKKLVFKTFIFLLLFTSLLAVFNYAYFKTDPYDTNKFNIVPKKIEICNIGASHSLYGFNYEDYADRYTAFNFGLGSQSHQYDYILLNHYKKNLKKGAIVFIVCSLPMIAGYDETLDDAFESMNRRYYTFLHVGEIRKYDFLTDLKMKLVPFTLAESLKDLFYNLIKGKPGNYWQRIATAEEIAEDAPRAALRHVVTNKTDDDGNVVYNEEAIGAIYKTIELCKEIGATPVMITTPFTDEYLSEVDKLAPEYYEHGFFDRIKKIQEDTGVAYFNYSDDERFKSEYSLFINSDHLNKYGAKKFTDIIMEEVVSNIKSET